MLSVDPDIGDPMPGTTSGPQRRENTDDVDSVRVLYFVLAPRTVVVVAYIEV